jgi:hypothetical protein
MGSIICVQFKRNYIQYNFVTSIITISGIVITITNGSLYVQKIQAYIFGLKTYIHWNRDVQFV